MQEKVAAVEQEKRQLELQLDNRTKNDTLFGPKAPPPNSMSRNLTQVGRG